MTTAYTGPTPYDDRIAALEEQGHYGGLNADGRMGLAHHRTLAEGYRRAMQDCAPLLEALRDLLRFAPSADGNYAGSGGTDEYARYRAVADRVRAAIRQAERGGQPASPHP